jgi:hypothetical protein
MPTEEIIVLANSKKLNGRCVAGISTASGEWLRPVSDLPRGELKAYHYEMDDHAPAVLDIVRFGFEKRLEEPAQPENVLLDEEDWQQVGGIDPEDAYTRLRPHLSTGPLLLGDNEPDVAEDVAAAGMAGSLALVEPNDEIEFEVWTYRGRRKARVIFRLGAEQYNLPVTDLAAEPRIKAAGNGSHRLGDVGFPGDGRVLLTVSLGEAFNGKHWKLVAAIIFLP